MSAITLKAQTFSATGGVTRGRAHGILQTIEDGAFVVDRAMKRTAAGLGLTTVSIFKERNITKPRKVLRELMRVKRSVTGLFAWIGFLKAQRKYDANWDNNVRVIAGEQALCSKIAIVVLYQPTGLRDSFFETLNHLKENGYSVLAVSNAPLSEADQAALKPHVWKMCERPNYGYDLGAYRDGVWLLRRRDVRPQHVILMNDSIWFPLCADNTAIARLEESGHGLNGLVRKTKASQDNSRSEEPSGFIEAYFYLANLKDAATLAWWDRFWTNLKLTAGRDYLKEGKVSYSYTKSGQKLYTIASRRTFLDAMKRLSDEELRDVLRYAAYPSANLRQEGQRLLESLAGDDWRQQVHAHLCSAVRLDPFYGVFPYGSERAFGLGFMKRTPKPLFKEMHGAYLRAVAAGALPHPMQHTLDEVTVRVDGYPRLD